MMQGLDNDGAKVRVGKGEAGKLLLLEPSEIVMLVGCPIPRVSGPRLDCEDANVEVIPSQSADEASATCSDHDAELFQQLASKGVEV